MASTRSRNPNPLCTSTSCADDRNEDRLLCSKCNRHVHYLCTQMPAYMIAACKDGRRPACNYVCQICVSVSQDLLALVPPTGSQPSIRTAANLSKLKETIKEKEKIIKEKDKTIIKLQTTEQHLLEIVETQKEHLTKLTKKISDESHYAGNHRNSKNRAN